MLKEKLRTNVSLVEALQVAIQALEETAGFNDYGDSRQDAVYIRKLRDFLQVIK
jgi:hypothetical protein